VPKPNRNSRAVRTLVLAAIALLLGTVFAAGARAGAGATPEGPENRIDIVPGLGIELPPLRIDSGFYEDVRFEVDGKPFRTESFEPGGFWWYVPTDGRFEHLGLEMEVVHTFTARVISYFFEESRVAAEYPLVIHPLPVVNKVEVVPIVVAGRPEIVGFDLSGLEPGYRVMAWGQGFRGTRMNKPLELVRSRGGAPDRTYRIRGGLEWSRGARPRLFVTVGARRRASKYHVPIRARVITTRLTTRRDGNTGYKQIDGWKRCAWDIVSGGYLPRRASCDRF
jgi:hypothetical protein